MFAWAIPHRNSAALTLNPQVSPVYQPVVTFSINTAHPILRKNHGGSKEEQLQRSERDLGETDTDFSLYTQIVQPEQCHKAHGKGL